MKHFIKKAIDNATYECDQILCARTIGDITLTLKINHDAYWYGTHGDTEYVQTDRSLSKGDYLYHRASETVCKFGSNTWRNAKGQICAAPETNDRSRECEFIRVRYALKGKYAIEDAQFLEKLNRGDCTSLICSAVAEFQGKEIGRSTLCGVIVEKINDSYLVDVFEDCLAEALSEARKILAAAVKTGVTA